MDGHTHTTPPPPSEYSKIPRYSRQYMDGHMHPILPSPQLTWHRAGGNSTAGMAMAVPVFEGENLKTEHFDI